MMSNSDRQVNYGYLLGTINLIRRELKTGAADEKVIEAVDELVFNERIGEMLKEFNLK